MKGSPRSARHRPHSLRRACSKTPPPTFSDASRCPTCPARISKLKKDRLNGPDSVRQFFLRSGGWRCCELRSGVIPGETIPQSAYALTDSVRRVCVNWAYWNRTRMGGVSTSTDRSMCHAQGYWGPVTERPGFHSLWPTAFRPTIRIRLPKHFGAGPP